MGYNTVAILLNDGLHMGARDPHLGEKIIAASRSYDRTPGPSPHRDIFAHSPSGGSGSYGSVISQDHADGYQVVVVHGNMGWRVDQVDHDKYLGWSAFTQMKDCLERNGYRVTKRRAPKSAKGAAP